MERENTQNRKRTRDEEDEKEESHEGKKQECISPVSKNIIYNDQNRYEFYDGIGVFDFPWLKEGVIFKGEDYLDEHEEEFAPCSYLDEAPGTFAANGNQSCSQDFSVSPAPDGNNELGDDSFWSLLIDDLEPVDCIWSCVIDQPLDIGFNKIDN